MLQRRSAAVFALLLAGLSGSAAYAALPPRAAVVRCIDEVARSGKAAGSAGPACKALRETVAADDTAPGDADLAKELGKANESALHDYMNTLPRPQSGSPVTRLDSGRVKAIVEALAAEAPKQKTIWQRLRDWLTRLMRPPERELAEHWPWLEKLGQWLGAIPPGVTRIVVWSVLGLLVASLLWVVIDEFRNAAGSRTRLPGRRTEPVSKPSAAMTAITLADIAKLPFAEQPGALLRWLIAALAADGRLPVDRALTNRELERLLPGSSGAGFRRVADQAERSVYGDLVPTAEQLAETTALVETLVQAQP